MSHFLCISKSGKIPSPSRAASTRSSKSGRWNAAGLNASLSTALDSSSCQRLMIWITTFYVREAPRADPHSGCCGKGRRKTGPSPIRLLPGLTEERDNLEHLPKAHCSHRHRAEMRHLGQGRKQHRPSLLEPRYPTSHLHCIL